MKKLVLLASIALMVILFSLAPASLAETEENKITIVKSLIETSLQDKDYYSLSCSKSGFIVKIAGDGVAYTAASYMMAGYDETKQEWVDYKNSVVEYAKSIQNFIEVAGIENPNLLFMVVDEYEFSSILLAIFNGEIIYDILSFV